jgi:hypothetical protein
MGMVRHDVNPSTWHDLAMAFTTLAGTMAAACRRRGSGIGGCTSSAVFISAEAPGARGCLGAKEALRDRFEARAELGRDFAGS